MATEDMLQLYHWIISLCEMAALRRSIRLEGRRVPCYDDLTITLIS
jgi:hypothetical protein